MSTKRQNQKEKQKMMPTLQEHNNSDFPIIFSSEVGECQKRFKNDLLNEINENYNLEKELTFEQIEQIAQIQNNNIVDDIYLKKLLDLTYKQDCKKQQNQNVQYKQTNDFQQLQEIQNPNQLERKISQKSKEAKSQNTLNEEIKNFEERIVKYTSEVNQETKLSPKISEEWKKKFSFFKKKK